MLSNVSFSALNSWFLCGESCKRTYFGERFPPGISAYRGRSFHDTVEVNHSQKIDSNLDLKLDYMQDYCRDQYVNSIKNNGYFLPKEDYPYKSKLLNQGLNHAVGAIKAYKEKIAPMLHPIKVELYMKSDIGLGMPISGRLDLIDSNGKIRDFKIGKKKQKNWEHKDLQPTFYSLLMYLKEKKIPDFEYNVIPPSGDVQVLPTARTFEDFKILIQHIKLFIKDISAGVFRPAQPGSWICTEKYCQYFSTCKYVGN